MVSNHINKIDKIIKWIQIITNVVLSSGWGVAVCWTRASSEPIVIESRYIKYKNNIVGPIPPGNHSFLK